MTAPAELREHPIFRDVPAELLARFFARGSIKQLKRRALVLEEDQDRLAVYALLSGSVRVFYRSPEGAEVVVKLFAAPAVFGEMECITGIPYLESVEVVENARLFELPREAFLEMLQASHAFAIGLLTDLAARLCIAAHNERGLAFLPVEARLANLFSSYLDLYGVPVAEGTLIRIPLSQDDLGNALGVARRSITRALKAWSDAGWIKKRGRHFVVVDRDALAASGEPHLLEIAFRSGSKPKR